MTDTKVFKLQTGNAVEISKETISLEKEIQSYFEKNLETMLGVRLLASEYSTTNGGRMDTLGIDEDNCPVIVEYKRTKSENVINQGLFYLDWLMDHKASFELLVRDQIGQDAAKDIGWSAPRLICIANDFSKYDEHAVKQINRNIELVRFQKFETDILLVELLTAQSVKPEIAARSGETSSTSYKTVSMYLEQSDEELKELFNQTRDALMSLGDDVQEKTLKFYFAFKRIKNFACIEVKPNERKILAYLKVDPKSIILEEGFHRDVSNIGHFGTGELEITIRNEMDLEKSLPFFLDSYVRS